MSAIPLRRPALAVSKRRVLAFFRGMDAAVARSLLTYAFLREVTAGVPEDLRGALDDRIAALLPDGMMAKELA